MILGIVSDTHSLNLPLSMLECFKTVDLIIHAGDICDADTIKQLKKLAPVVAVHGNMDDASLKKQLTDKLIVDCEGVKVGVAHGHIGDNRDAYLNVQVLFKDEKVGIVIFGHSHQALNEQKGSVLYFNPGSPNDVVKARFFSYGMIEIKGGAIKAEIIKL